MTDFTSPRQVKVLKPKPRIKKGSSDTVTVVRKAARTGDEDFADFVATGKFRSIK